MWSNQRRMSSMTGYRHSKSHFEAQAGILEFERWRNVRQLSVCAHDCIGRSQFYRLSTRRLQNYLSDTSIGTITAQLLSLHVSTTWRRSLLRALLLPLRIFPALKSGQCRNYFTISEKIVSDCLMLLGPFSFAYTGSCSRRSY